MISQAEEIYLSMIALQKQCAYQLLGIAQVTLLRRFMVLHLSNFAFRKASNSTSSQVISSGIFPLTDYTYASLSEDAYHSDLKLNLYYGSHQSTSIWVLSIEFRKFGSVWQHFILPVAHSAIYGTEKIRGFSDCYRFAADVCTSMEKLYQ